jgi:hypothetical protein
VRQPLAVHSDWPRRRVSPAGTVSRILGHADFATTADVYAHLTPAMLDRAAERMEAILGVCSGTTGGTGMANGPSGIAERGHFVLIGMAAAEGFEPSIS